VSVVLRFAIDGIAGAPYIHRRPMGGAARLMPSLPGPQSPAPPLARQSSGARRSRCAAGCHGHRHRDRRPPQARHTACKTASGRLGSAQRAGHTAPPTRGRRRRRSPPRRAAADRGAGGPAPAAAPRGHNQKTPSVWHTPHWDVGGKGEAGGPRHRGGGAGGPCRLVPVGKRVAGRWRGGKLISPRGMRDFGGSSSVFSR